MPILYAVFTVDTLYLKNNETGHKKTCFLQTIKVPKLSDTYQFYGKHAEIQTPYDPKDPFFRYQQFLSLCRVGP